MVLYAVIYATCGAITYLILAVVGRELLEDQGAWFLLDGGAVGGALVWPATLVVGASVAACTWVASLLETRRQRRFWALPGPERRQAMLRRAAAEGRDVEAARAAHEALDACRCPCGAEARREVLHEPCCDKHGVPEVPAAMGFRWARYSCEKGHVTRRLEQP